MDIPVTSETRIWVRENRNGDNTSSTIHGLTARIIMSASDTDSLSLCVSQEIVCADFLACLYEE